MVDIAVSAPFNITRPLPKGALSKNNEVAKYVIGGVVFILPTCSTSTSSVGAKSQSGQCVTIGGIRTMPHLVHLQPSIFFSSLIAKKNGENSPILRS